MPNYDIRLIRIGGQSDVQTISAADAAATKAAAVSAARGKGGAVSDASGAAESAYFFKRPESGALIAVEESEYQAAGKGPIS